MKYIFQRTPAPRTTESLKTDLIKIGVTPGMTLLIHASLSSIGWVNGGAPAVILALMETVTNEGTLVMPAQSGSLSDPSEWQYPPIPDAWLSEVKDTMPGYHPLYTPCEGMGIIADVFRTFPGTSRSLHPAVSFSAWGKESMTILHPHPLDFGLGPSSPLGRMYERDAHVLFIGTGYETNTAFHLAEYRIPNQPAVRKASPILNSGKKVWKEYEEIVFKEERFSEIGRDFDKRPSVASSTIGSAPSRLFSIREAVDFAEKWLLSQ